MDPRKEDLYKKEKSQKDYCPEEFVEDPCPEDPREKDSSKKQIQIPELSPFCKADAVKKCIFKLKELQNQWEDILAAQENLGKDDCKNSHNIEPASRKHKRSNMIYVVLSAILASVMYFIYNEDFEVEELFLEDEEIRKDNDEDDS